MNKLPRTCFKNWIAGLQCPSASTGIGGIDPTPERVPATIDDLVERFVRVNHCEQDRETLLAEWKQHHPGEQVVWIAPQT
jgi:hypothetical protein